MNIFGLSIERRPGARLPWRTAVVAIAAVNGIVLTTGVASAFWTTTGSGTGLARSATVTNLSITAVASPSPTNLLYPGASGDAVLQIANPNSFPVEITAVQLPTNATYADGYTDSSLGPTFAKASCSSSTPSDVVWNFATATSGSSHSLTSSLTVAANGTLTVTMTNDVSMTSAAPLACAGTYFKLPALTGVTSTSTTASATTSPTTDSWTS